MRKETWSHRVNAMLKEIISDWNRTGTPSLQPSRPLGLFRCDDAYLGMNLADKARAWK